MQESLYRSEALTFVTNLTNAPPPTSDQLQRRWEQSGLAADKVLRATSSDVAAVRQFSDEWAGVVDAPDNETRVHMLNTLLAGAAAYPRITNHDDSGWHLHYRDDNVALSSVIRAVAVVAAAEHLTKHGMHRLNRCALKECHNAFVDVTRGGHQRYCTRICANRDAVRRHRSKALP